MTETISRGVLRVLDRKNKPFYTAQDVVSILDVSESKAYKMIRELRQECIDEGKLSKCYPLGKVPKKYFDLKILMVDDDVKEG